MFNMKDRRLVLIVTRDGVPHAQVTSWSNARRCLQVMFYGVEGEPVDLSDRQEESARWGRFSDLDSRWSIDQEARPFEYEGENLGDGCLRGVFLNLGVEA